MYNIIFKSVVYLSIITSFFIVILYSDLFSQDTYYTWNDKNGVTHITKELSDIPKDSNQKLKKYKKTGSNILFNQINNISEQNKKYVTYILFVVISIFVILILLRNINKNFQNSRKKSIRNKKLNRIESSGITKITENNFIEASILIIKKLGYEIEITDRHLKKIIDYTGNINGKQYAVSMLFSDNPISRITMNELVLEGIKTNTSRFLVISNNFFSDEALKYKENYEMEMIDREKMAEYILKFGINLR